MSIIPVKGKVNPGAFSGELICPFCNATKWKFVENVTPTRLRYRCKACNQTIQYDISNRPTEHPYAPFKKRKWMDLVERSKVR